MKPLKNLLSTLAAVGSLSVGLDAGLVLNVELNTVDNTLSISGTGANSIATFSTGNFPYVELSGFFSDTTNTLVNDSAPITESLADYNGSTYQYLFDESWFISVRPDSLGLLNRDLSVHSFSTAQSAFTGVTTWDISSYGIELTDLNISGDVFANQNSSNDGAETLIGTWAIVPEPSSALWVGLGAALLVWLRRKKR